MSELELEARERDVPALAVEALNAASAVARASGLPTVFAESGRLVRREPDGSRQVIRDLPQPTPVVDRVIQART